MYDDRYGINSRLTILTGIYGYLVDGPQDRACEPSDNSTDLEGNHVHGLAPHKDSHLQIYSPVPSYPGLNTDFISERWFQLLLQDFVS